MRVLSLFGWVAFVAVGSKGDVGWVMSPARQAEQCRSAMKSYAGPPMPRILKPTFSGSGCPSGGWLSYNYVGKWRCNPTGEPGSEAWDAQFIMPDVPELHADGGRVAKAECAITFQVEGLGQGYQVALDGAKLENEVEAKNAEVTWNGAAGWEGGNHDVSALLTACNENSDCVASTWGADLRK